MKTKSIRNGLLAVAWLTLIATPVSAALPVVKPVRWVASNPLIPHDTYPTKSIRLKATTDSQGANFQYTWDFGDGSPVVTGSVSNKYILEASHTYAGAIGTVFTARITVKNTTTGETTTKPYYVALRAKALPVEVNVAIDEGLWNLHKYQTKSGADGYWWTSGYYSETAINVNAFAANGHVESGDPENPYVETSNRGMRTLFQWLYARGIPAADDANGNTLGIYVNQSPASYQGGIFMDAIIASGTPNATAPTGPANVIGRKYKDIIQDMCDDYNFAQYNANHGTGILGGWRYDAGQFPDNSACQWAAIGMIPAERSPLFACVIPPYVKTYNLNWLAYSQRSDGAYGYTDQNPLSGIRFGTTPSGMVQCAFDGIGRGNPLWDKSETLMRDNWGVGGDYSTNPLFNYYGLFAFVKAMRLHDSNGDKIAEPLQYLQSSTPGKAPIDWYSAQTAAYGGTDTVNGVARTVVNDQTVANGSWPEKGWFDGYGLQTARAILMLGQTLFESGGPVAVATATPNPAVANQLIALNGTNSFHQDAGRSIVSYVWDLDNNGSFETPGPFASVSFPAVGSYPVKLRVTDNSSPAKTADDQLILIVDTPPLAPTASAGGPYSFCPGLKWFLDGSKSKNPDEGQSEPGKPGDTMSYAWDLDGDGQFDDATGATPDVTAFIGGLGVGSHLIQLRVTDTTSTSFPSSGLGNLSDTDSTVVEVRSATDPACNCIRDLVGRAKPGKVDLLWTHSGADHYNVYRGTVTGGPYLKIGSTTSTYSTYLDSTVTNGVTYYYVVRGADALDREKCQSNEASAKPVATRR